MKKKKWHISTVLLFLAGVALIAVSLLLLIPPLLEREQAQDTYEGLKEVNVTIETSLDDIVYEEDDEWWYDAVDVDIYSLKQINEDIVGWLRFDHIEILSYPLLYSGDDETYLKTDVYGNPSSSGCIFIEGANQPDLSDCHTIIYGHNMKNSSMFGSLKDYKKEGFYEENQYFTIYTEDMAYRYQIFAYRDVPEDHSVYTVGFAPNEKFEDFIGELCSGSYLDTGIEVGIRDKVVTLSTCSETGKRFVLHAVRIDEHEYRESM